jgi:hypothetical protein
MKKVYVILAEENVRMPEGVSVIGSSAFAPNAPITANKNGKGATRVLSAIGSNFGGEGLGIAVETPDGKKAELFSRFSLYTRHTVSEATAVQSGTKDASGLKSIKL